MPVRLSLDGYSKLLLVTVFLAGSSSAAHGQHLSPPQAGARVRVRSSTTGKEWQHGNLVQIDRDSLTLDTGSDSLSLAAHSVTKLQVSRGKRSNAGKGAKIGAGVGLGLGAILSAAAAADESCLCSDIGVGDAILVSAFIGAVGAGIGAAIGSASHSERWATVEQPWFSLRVQPSATRAGLLLAMRF